MNFKWLLSKLLSRRRGMFITPIALLLATWVMYGQNFPSAPVTEDGLPRNFPFIPNLGQLPGAGMEAAKPGEHEPAGFQPLAGPSLDGPLRSVPVFVSQEGGKGAGDKADIPPEQRAMLGAARAAVQRGELKTALSRFDEFLSLNPNDNKVRLEYTGILVRAKEFKRAVGQYQRLIKVMPESVPIQLGLANVYLQLAKPAQAIPHLLVALKGEPRNTDIATKLARAYLGIQEVDNAKIVFERMLSSVHPNDANIPLEFGRLLLDLNRPRQALPFLVALSERHVDNPDLWAQLIRGKAWVGLREEATQLIGLFETKAPKNIKVRVELGDALYRIGEYKLAGLIYGQALNIDAHNILASLGMARVAIQMFDIDAAVKVVESCPLDTAKPELIALVRGELYLKVGKYAEAISTLHAYLQRDEDDIECRATLAKVYETTEDYEKAKSEWAKLSLVKGASERGTIGVAVILAAQRRFAESNALCEYVLAKDPEDPKAIAQIIYNLGKMRKVDQALTIGRAYLDGLHQDDIGSIFVGLTLGQALLENGAFAEAAVIYDKVTAFPQGRVSAAFFGLYYAHEHLQDVPEPRRILQPMLDGTMRERLELADIASAFNINDLIVELCNSVLATCPQHVPSLLRRSEAELRQATVDWDIDPTVATCCVIFKISPTNVRARFTIARAYTVAQNYPRAFIEYDKLIKTNPDLMQARKELARTMYAAQAYRAGHAQYDVAEFPTGDEVLQDAVGHLSLIGSGTARPLPPPPAWSPIPLPPPTPVLEVKKKSRPDQIMAAFAANSGGPTVSSWGITPLASPNGPLATAKPISPLEGILASLRPANPPTGPASRWGAAPLPAQRPLAESKTPLELLLASFQEPPAEMLPEPRPLTAEDDEGADFTDPAQEAADKEAFCQRQQKRLNIEVEARAAEVKSLKEEQVANSRKDLRNHQAVGAYGTVLANQPDNTSSMSNLAEMYGALGLTRATIATTRQLLEVQPYNRDAQQTLEWASAALQPRFNAQTAIGMENGRNGLARIETDQYTTSAICPYGDENDYVGLAYSRIAFVPHGYPILTGNIETLLVGKQITDYMKFNAELNYQEFPRGFADRPTFDSQLGYDITDAWHVYVGGFLKNVAENGASIAQDIYRGGFELGGTYHIMRELDLQSFYRLSGYSDNNLEHEAFLRLAYRLFPDPCELKFLSSVLFYSFDETNPLSNNSNSPSFSPVLPPNFRHPYFAPLCFFYFEERLAFKQTLSRDLFKYSDHCYYQLEYGLGVDNHSAVYNNFRLVFNYDVNIWLKVGFSADAVVSSVYNQGRGLAFIELRFPPHP